MLSKNHVPNAMRNAFEKAGHPDVKHSKAGYDHAFDGKGWNASLSYQTYQKLKVPCGLD